MSRGNRQKVALVLALAHSPRLVILDEPTSGLDPLMQDTLMMCLRELANEGRTVMFSSHTLSEVETLCDRIAIVRDGQIVEDSRLVALKELQRASDIQWPSGAEVKYVPSSSPEQYSSTIALLVPPSLRHRTCVLELLGTSTPFMQWAAGQNFADVVIGPPALEALFRRYYQE
jgi:ABC-2 type transport system ATP-binding protein